MTDRRGGRIRPDGRAPQAKGQGKNAKRHDLERPATPGLHGSDLQQGDVQALEQGQRIAPAKSNPEGQAPPAPAQGQPSQPVNTSSQPVNVPDPIQFLAERNGSGFELPNAKRQIDSSGAMTWLGVLRGLASGPGASSALVSAFINQARAMSSAGGHQATIVDMSAADDGIEAMLDAGIGGE